MHYITPPPSASHVDALTRRTDLIDLRRGRQHGGSDGDDRFDPGQHHHDDHHRLVAVDVILQTTQHPMDTQMCTGMDVYTARGVIQKFIA